MEVLELVKRKIRSYKFTGYDVGFREKDNNFLVDAYGLTLVVEKIDGLSEDNVDSLIDLIEEFIELTQFEVAIGDL